MSTEILKSNYESILVVSCKLGEDGINAVVEKFKALIEANAELKETEVWGVRKLAYLIQKQSEGYYVLFRFESEPDFPAELDRVYNITDGVLRSIIVKLDPKSEQPKKAEQAEAVEE